MKLSLHAVALATGALFCFSFSAYAQVTTASPTNDYSSSAYVGSSSTSPLKDILFKTNGTERIRVGGTSGYLGIGTTLPNRKLVISNSGAEGMEMHPWSGYTQIISYNRSTSTYIPLVLQDANGGYVGIGINTPKDKLDVGGNIRLNNNTLYLRAGTDNNHGLAYTNTFAGKAVDGPVCFGWNGGVLATKNGGDKIALRWDSNGKVIIGNVSTPGNYMLYVEKGILTEKLKIASSTTSYWADYVFALDYQLRSIEELETFVKENKHLPNVPSAKEVAADGIDIAKMDATLLEKIEELSLYVIQLKKENAELVKRLDKIENRSF
ncbi:MAG: hypothetical protein H6585_07100 [Flavobacteriales bacterium]|nr:hypothetical protein [Flavobacteriales bacterium]MCB9448094.1 hypothetical protein [Flavobacteriales bacterium]